MLHKTVVAAIPYATQLESKGIHLTLTSDSHLNALVSHSYLAGTSDYVEQDSFVKNIENSIIVKGGITEYENYLHTMVDELAEMVQSHVRNSREVGQVAKEMAEVVRRYQENAPDVSATSDFNIIKDESSVLAQMPAVFNSLSERIHTSVKPESISALVSGHRTVDDMLKMLLTGNDNMDDAIRTTISSYGDSFLENVWYGLLSNAGDSVYDVRSLNQLPAAERFVVAYVGYLFAERLFSEVPEDAIGALSVFQNNAADLKVFLLVTAGNALDERQKMNDTGVVVIAFIPQTRSVVVNAENYRKWLEEGGSPEVVLGALLNDCGSFTAENLNANSGRYLDSWNAYSLFHNAERDVRRANFMRSIYQIAYTESLNNIRPFEEDFRKSHPSFAETSLSEVVKAVEFMSLEKLMCVERVCLELVAGIRFSYTPSLLILDNIDRILKESPDADVREAALVAACDYMALYLSGQISVHKVN